MVDVVARNNDAHELLGSHSFDHIYQP
jgi:hypothetical protein